jgi:hypothetical protein
MRGITMTDVTTTALIDQIVTVIGPFGQPFEYFTQLQRHSAAVVARSGEARPDDSASSRAILPGAVSAG